MKPTNRSVDLNSDLGESFGPWKMGDDETMLSLVTSANVACGGHASDPETMFRTLSVARECNVVIGAHPGYPDPLGFGRRRIPYSPSEIQRFCVAQIGALCGVAAVAGAQVHYVKPHGALANLAADDRDVAEAIVAGVAAMGGLAILAISGTELEGVARARGMQVYSEIFADRSYTARGRLVPRDHPQAMITDPDIATGRLVRFFESGLMPSIEGAAVRLKADSICIHGDSPHAVAMAHRLKSGLIEAGIAIAPFIATSPVH
jgi:5-oxoprolinase (ATP-hydrolysing) subunit A